MEGLLFYVLMFINGFLCRRMWAWLLGTIEAERSRKWLTKLWWPCFPALYARRSAYIAELLFPTKERGSRP